MSFTAEFGNRLRQIRYDLGLSQEEMAFRCNLQASHISQLERGEKSPTLDTLEKIAGGLHLSLLQLLDSDYTPLNPFDETTNKIISCVLALPPFDRTHILSIVKTFINREE